ncbi:hypothetical protein B9J78_01050 [bacterium Unc6]|nr:hypothetical protein [bacterium Unc6]
MGNILETLNQKRVLLLDGAMGTRLQEQGLQSGEAPELWNIKHPEIISLIHKEYVGAGSDVILTNTFGGNLIKLKKAGIEVLFKDINSAAVRIARSAEADYVFGDIGPTGELLEPYGELKTEDAIDVFKKQGEVLTLAGVDGFIIETMIDVEEAVCAVKGLKQFGLPIFSSITFQKTKKGEFRTLMGQTPQGAAVRLKDEGSCAVGTNCGLVIEEMIGLVKQISTSVSVPIIAEPNAGIPKIKNGKTVFEQTPADFASHLKMLIDAGASIIGGCCGTTPSFIKALKKELEISVKK